MARRKTYRITFDNHDGFDPKRDVETVIAKSAAEAVDIVRRLPYVKPGADIKIVQR